MRHYWLEALLSRFLSWVPWRWVALVLAGAVAVGWVGKWVGWWE